MQKLTTKSALKVVDNTRDLRDLYQSTSDRVRVLKAEIRGRRLAIEQNKKLIIEAEAELATFGDIAALKQSFDAKLASLSGMD